ncbi:hypothetical protein OAL72_01795 [bacterium]|nr:hypothetical protein [bacterium]
MKTGRFTQSDSTGLLLDTVCNVFGGIILIALLVALLAQETESQLKLDVNPDARMELLQRRVDRIIAENTRVRTKNAEMEKQLAALIDPAIGKLLDTIESSKQELARMRNSLVAMQRKLEISNLDADDLLENLKQARAEANAELAREESRSLRLEAQLSQFKQQEQELTAQRKAAREKQTVRLRLPKERTTGKEHVWVLVQYGKLYPTYLRQGSREIRNNISIRWTNQLGSRKAEPIADRGIAVLKNGEEWQRYLRSLDARREYIAFVVWPDSYKAFNAAKLSAVSRGMSYGWEIWESSQDIYFGPNGTHPDPQ